MDNLMDAIEFDLNEQALTDENGFVLEDQETKTSTKQTVKTSNKPEKVTEPEVIEDDFSDEELEEADEEVETDEEEIEDKTKSPSTKNEDLDNVFSTLARELKESEILPDLTDEELGNIKTTEDLFKAVENQFSSWSSIYKANLVNNLIAEGLIEASQVKSNVYQGYSKSDIANNLNLQKEIAKRYYQKKGLPEKKINDFIENTLDLETDAVEFNEYLKQDAKEDNKKLAEDLKKKEEDISKQRDVFNNTLKKNTLDIEEFIPGKKLKASDKEVVLRNITPTLNKVNSDLTKYAPILAYLDYYGILDGKFDKIMKEVESKSVSKLSEILKEKKKSTSDTSVRTSTNSNISDAKRVPQIFKH